MLIWSGHMERATSQNKDGIGRNAIGDGNNQHDVSSVRSDEDQPSPDSVPSSPDNPGSRELRDLRDDLIVGLRDRHSQQVAKYSSLGNLPDEIRTECIRASLNRLNVNGQTLGRLTKNAIERIRRREKAP